MTLWIVQVSSGAGPVEVREFVSMLATKIRDRCLASGAVLRSVSTVGDEATPQSVQFAFRGSIGEQLRESIGTHVLVARSRHRGRRARKRWFAGVSLHQERTASGPALEIRRSDLEITAARAGGPGGQHVNTTDSAIRVRHLPTGITVRVASQRSQHRNRSEAIRRLEGLLAERDENSQRARASGRRIAHYQFERGSAVQVWFVDELSSQLRRAEDKRGIGERL